MSIIGLDFYGTSVFKSTSPPVRDVKRADLSNAIFDEMHIRSETSNIDTTSTKQEWQIDTKLLAKFTNDLEAGNINNNGIQIEKFAIKRRKIEDLDSLTLGYEDFVNNTEFKYIDYTQGTDDYVYSIVPVGSNELEGEPNDININSTFVGWHIVDRETNNIISFDQFMDSEPNINTRLNQGRVQIDTMSKYPSFFYTDQEYHSFSLQSTFLKDDWVNTGSRYNSILNQFISNHKPFLVKSGNGELYICDISNPQKDNPLNSYRERDYITLTINLTEVMDYEEYIEEY